MIVGIDLGTTNSLVSIFMGDSVNLVPNFHGHFLTPSVVGVDIDGHMLVGQAAKEMQVTQPDRCVSAFKRYMGTKKLWQLGEHAFLAEELSSFVIKSLISDVEREFNVTVDEAVISVPAYFNDTQRKATKRAGELAGIRVDRMISEPTAAALAYGYNEKPHATYIVIDLGGGTFDVSVIEACEGIIEVKSIAGDNYLGGEDFTQIIFNEFMFRHQMIPSKTNRVDIAKIWKESEVAKRALTSRKSVQMSVLINGEHKQHTIESSRYELLCEQLLTRFRQPLVKSLRDAGISLSDLEGVILVGGATRMPMIRSYVGKLFGQMPFIQVNPDEVVAIGAGVQAGLKSKDIPVNELIFTDVCPYSLGIDIVKIVNGSNQSGFFSPIIERNTIIPVSRSDVYQTVYDMQTEIRVPIYQGEGRLVADNIYLGEITISVLPKPAGHESIDVRFTYDINGILEVIVKTLSTGETKKLIIEKEPGLMTKDELDERMENLSHLKVHPKDQMENKYLLLRCERIYQELLGDEREYMANIILWFEECLQKQDIKEIQSRYKEIQAFLDQFDLKCEF